MPSLKHLIKDIEQVAKAQLAEVGFRKRKVTFTKDINSETIGVVGFQRSTYHHEQVVDIYPIIGMINRSVGKYTVEWSGIDNVKHSVAMIPEPLCYVLPENDYKSWEFEPGCDTGKIVEDIVGGIVRHGVLWMESLSSTEAFLTRQLKHPEPAPEYYRYTIPAAYYALGRKEEAREYVKKVIEETSNHWNKHQREWGEKYAEVMLRI